MTQKRMERIVKGRRLAQGIGALGGTLTVFAALGAIYGEDMKKEAKNIAAEVQEKIPEPAKKLIAEAKEKVPETAKKLAAEAKDKLGI